ncbi:3'-5' exonuclease [Vibrio phage vB_VpaS_1601]|uniref:DNA polymerase exonuclease subunit n=1 Tax=Vibrio phage SHOU24 TaxID=1414739 RepID=UPI0003ED22A6|nr:DNA polymerase exonuclease subunit [Vibrio phage SHOU24]AHI61212.1 3'-5' exonuclease [Vibrio phage SHOU24]WHM52759.1 3'-5' exonuclease [Vibrio phage vB_VpaP_1601]
MKINKIDLSDSIILDTETTGLDSKARIVEIALICGATGKVLYESLVNPMCKIPYHAGKVHGITDAEVSDAPTFDKVWDEIKGLFEGKVTVIYNSDYDYRLIEQSLSDFDYPVKNLVHFIRPVCAMKWYSKFYGSGRWQGLSKACEQQDVNASDLKAHRAAADCEMTRRLINAVNLKII